MQYIKPLDSLRAIAVTLVIIAHWSHWTIPGVLDFGGIGVNLFFVLSGFLITRILLTGSDRAGESPDSRKQLLRSFYFRRSLRIFPIYYLLIFIMMMVQPTNTGIAQNYPWYLSYTSNFMNFFQQKWDGMLSHLWSLSVEEQFYLLWPWLMVFIPRKHTLKIILSFIAIGIASMLVFSIAAPSNEFAHVLTFCCFDAFGLGALLAYFLMYREQDVVKYKRYGSVIALICLVIYCLPLVADIDLHSIRRTLISVCSVILIAWVIRSPQNFLVRTALSWKWMTYLGKISYGIYLYHNITPWLLGQIKVAMKEHQVIIPFVNANIPASIDGYWTVLQQIFLLLFMSWISWNIVERPMNKLKDRFSYAS